MLMAVCCLILSTAVLTDLTVTPRASALPMIVFNSCKADLAICEGSPDFRFVMICIIFIALLISNSAVIRFIKVVMELSDKPNPANKLCNCSFGSFPSYNINMHKTST